MRLNRPIPVTATDLAFLPATELSRLVRGRKLAEQVENLERQLIREALDRCAGNQSRAATILGINRGTLRKKLKAYKLPGR